MYNYRGTKFTDFNNLPLEGEDLKAFLKDKKSADSMHRPKVTKDKRAGLIQLCYAKLQQKEAIKIEYKRYWDYTHKELSELAYFLDLPIYGIEKYIEPYRAMLKTFPNF